MLCAYYSTIIVSLDINFTYKIMMSVMLEITSVPKIVQTFLVHTSVCATLDMSSNRMATPVQVRGINAIIKLYAVFVSIDINECELGYCNQLCNNTAGSFICSCQDGYALGSDNRTCTGKPVGLWFVPALILQYRY